MRTLTLEHDYSIDKSVVLGGLGLVGTWEDLGSTAEVERVDGDIQVTVRTPLSASDLPAALASRLPGGAELIEIYVLPGDVIGAAAEVRMTAHADGVPVEIDALMQFTDADADAAAGSHVSVRAEISSSIPLFGSMVEEALTPILRKKMAERLESFARL